MQLRWTGQVAFLVSAFCGGIGYALPAEDHPLLKTGALVLSGLALVALIVVLVVAYRRRHGTDEVESALPAKIKAKDSANWTIKRTRSKGDQPFVEAENSPGWSLEDVTLGDDEQGPPEETGKE